MAFKVTEDKYISILNRLVALEQAHNNTAIAIRNLASLQQVKELLVILQTTLTEIDNKVISLQNRIVAIEQEPLS